MKLVAAEADEKFVSGALSSGVVPLPIFNKIKNKFLLLQDYEIEPVNFTQFVNHLLPYIPNCL